MVIAAQAVALVGGFEFPWGTEKRMTASSREQKSRDPVLLKIPAAVPATYPVMTPPASLDVGETENQYPARVLAGLSAAAKGASIKQAWAELRSVSLHLPSGDPGPNAASVLAKPALGNAVWYVTSALLILASDSMAAVSLAAICDRNKFGSAMAASKMTRTTTISSSAKVKPAELRIASGMERELTIIRKDQKRCDNHGTSAKTPVRLLL